jgi:hypothetical protein
MQYLHMALIADRSEGRPPMRIVLANIKDSAVMNCVSFLGA